MTTTVNPTSLNGGAGVNGTKMGLDFLLKTAAANNTSSAQNNIVNNPPNPHTTTTFSLPIPSQSPLTASAPIPIPIPNVSVHQHQSAATTAAIYNALMNDTPETLSPSPSSSNPNNSMENQFEIQWMPRPSRSSSTTPPLTTPNTATPPTLKSASASASFAAAFDSKHNFVNNQTQAHPVNVNNNSTFLSADSNGKDFTVHSPSKYPTPSQLSPNVTPKTSLTPQLQSLSTSDHTAKSPLLINQPSISINLTSISGEEQALSPKISSSPTGKSSTKEEKPLKKRKPKKTYIQVPNYQKGAALQASLGLSTSPSSSPSTSVSNSSSNSFTTYPTVVIDHSNNHTSIPHISVDQETEVYVNLLLGLKEQDDHSHPIISVSSPRKRQSNDEQITISNHLNINNNIISSNITTNNNNITINNSHNNNGNSNNNNNGISIGDNRQYKKPNNTTA